jgi:hypothetical protein
MWDLATLIYLNEKACADHSAAQEKLPPAEAVEHLIQDLDSVD